MSDQDFVFWIVVLSAACIALALTTTFICDRISDRAMDRLADGIAEVRARAESER